MKKRILSVLLALALVLVPFPGLGESALAAYTPEELLGYIQETAGKVTANLPEPTVGSVGGDWLILGLARSGADAPEGYYAKYYAAVEAAVKEHQGVLNDHLITDNDRVILALSALGKDARDVAGYDLTLPLGDFDKVCRQGLNGPMWALIALDCRDYPMPKAPAGATQATRQMYVDRLLGCQLPDGGWTLKAGTPAAAENVRAGKFEASADPDMTAMALQALAKYRDQPEVYDAVERGLTCLSLLQNKKGGYEAWGGENCESAAQVIVALCELGLSPDHAQFVKNGFTLLDSMLSFRNAEGYFNHTRSSGADGMATEQALYAMAAVLRAQQGKNSLYRMGDAESVPLEGAAAPQGSGLAGKDPDVQQRPVTKPGITFGDIKNSPNKAAIEALAAREIINGKGENVFDPDNTMTRAEFCTITVKALGLTPKANDKFRDVAAKAWYAPYVGTANAYGIVNGVSDTEFNPSGTISRQEAAVMTVRAAKLCGLDTALSDQECADILCDYLDYRTVASWARGAMAYCYGNELLDTAALSIRPKESILRCEVAEILYRMMALASLI